MGHQASAPLLELVFKVVVQQTPQALLAGGHSSQRLVLKGHQLSVRQQHHRENLPQCINCLHTSGFYCICHKHSCHSVRILVSLGNAVGSSKCCLSSKHAFTWAIDDMGEKGKGGAWHAPDQRQRAPRCALTPSAATRPGTGGCSLRSPAAAASWPQPCPLSFPCAAPPAAISCPGHFSALQHARTSECMLERSLDCCTVCCAP